MVLFTHKNYLLFLGCSYTSKYLHNRVINIHTHTFKHTFVCMQNMYTQIIKLSLKYLKTVRNPSSHKLKLEKKYIQNLESIFFLPGHSILRQLLSSHILHNQELRLSSIKCFLSFLSLLRGQVFLLLYYFCDKTPELRQFIKESV